MCGRVVFVVMLGVVTSYFVVAAAAAALVRCSEMGRVVVAGCDGKCCDDEHCGLECLACALDLCLLFQSF